MVAVLVGMLFLPQTQTQLVMTTIPVTAIFIVVLMLETNPSANP
jgi:L-asparagine transporter-like permease